MKKADIYTTGLKLKKGINVWIELKIDFKGIYGCYNAICILYSILYNVY